MRSFDNDLKSYDLNSAYREIVERILRAYFHTEKVYKINSKEQHFFYAYVLEKLGIDYVILQDEEEGELFKKIITVQLKIRDSKYYMKDICIEVMHESLQDRSTKSLGYIFDIKADYLLYIWANDDKKLLLSPILLINVDRLKRFFDKNKSKYDLIPTKGSYSTDKAWITYNMFIPLEDCSNCYEIINMEDK